MSDELNENISWTPYLEKYFADTAERASCMAWLHQQSEAIYSRRKVFIELPAIILSSVIGFGSVGSSTMFSGQTETASLVLGCMSLGVSVLQTVGSFFSWSKRAENHRLSAIQYSKLHRFIGVELKLPEKERIRPSDFLKMVKDTYDRLQETSPAIPDQVVSSFKKKFTVGEYADVSKPMEANGLEKVVIYKEVQKEKPTTVVETPNVATNTSTN